MDIQVKKLDASYIETIMSLEREVYEPIGGPVFGPMLIAQTITREPDDQLCLGAFDGNRLVGYILACLTSHDIETAEWYICDFAVLHELQGKGIGQLMSAEFAKQAMMLPIVGDDFRPSYMHDTRSGIWEQNGYSVKVLGPTNSGQQVRVRREFEILSRSVKIWYLPSWEADRIAALEREVYPPDFWCGEEDFREDLETAEKHGANFSYGIVDRQNQLMAYLVAYVKKSESRHDMVIYGSDLAVHPDRQRMGLGMLLLGNLVRQAAERGIPCEGECRKASLELLKKSQSSFLAAVGYKLVSSKRLKNYNGGEDHFWVRVEPEDYIVKSSRRIRK